MTDLISDERVSKSLRYLAETDEPCARAKALYDGLEEQSKTIFATIYLQLPKDRTVEEKKSMCYAHVMYTDHQVKVQEANADFEIMKNKRKTEELIVEVWRTVQANRRRGNM